MEERLTAAAGELLATVRSGVATVTLNRPGALNALTLGMIRGLREWLAAWSDDADVRTVVLRGAGDKAFCAGGDIRALHDAVKSNHPLARTFFEEEYALDFAIHTFPKPVVALIDGIVMGGGMGLSQGAALRIVGERTRMAMPETSIGLFPDVGGSYFLSRLPGQLGPYLGLLGPTLRAADAVYCGLADLDVSPTPAAGELQPLRAAIDAHFAHESIEAIAASLATESREPYREWARKTLDGLGRRSPTLLKVTLQQLRRAASLSLAECFRMELNLINACMEQGDLVEGIRALVIDKDNRPRWQPPTLAEVSADAVQRFFEPRWPAAHHPLAHL